MRMRQTTLLFLALTAGAATAQQELPQADSGPMHIAPQPPQPDQNGVYQVGPGITPPQLTVATPAVYPTDAQPLDRPLICVVSTVIDVNGAPTNIALARGCKDEAFLAPSIDAVKRSQFQPGTLNGKPVPVLVHVNVAFRIHEEPAVPRLALPYREGFAGSGPARPRQYDKPPVPIHFANPEFSEEARRNKIQGTVFVSVLVNEEGIPIDPRLEKGLGHGLDEKALEAALEYRFKPSTRDGAPVEARITIEMNFHLY